MKPFVMRPLVPSEQATVVREVLPLSYAASYVTWTVCAKQVAARTRIDGTYFMLCDGGR